MNRTPHINKTQLRTLIDTLKAIREAAPTADTHAQRLSLVVEPLTKLITDLTPFVGVILLAVLLAGCSPLY